MRSVVLALLIVIAPRVAGQQSQIPRISGFVTTSDGERLHYIEAGRGPAMLFVPGLTMPAMVWDLQVDYFSRSHRVVAIDPRSHGDSSHAKDGHEPDRMGRDIADVISQLKLAPVVLVGWSMGTPEVLGYINRFGTRDLAGVVFVDGFIGDDPNPSRAAGHERTIAAIEADRRGWTIPWIRGMFVKPQADEWLTRLVDASLKTPTTTMTALIRTTYVAGDDRRSILAKIDRPLLYMGRPSMRAQAAMVQARVPAATVEIFDQSGHALFIDESARFNRVLEAFIRTIR